MNTLDIIRHHRDKPVKVQETFRFESLFRKKWHILLPIVPFQAVANWNFGQWILSIAPYYISQKCLKRQGKVRWHLNDHESSEKKLLWTSVVFIKAELLPLPPKISFKTVFLNKRRKIWIMKLFALSLFFWLNHKVHYLLQMTVRAFYHILSYLWNPSPIL